jgi:hypothetical protein
LVKLKPPCYLSGFTSKTKAKIPKFAGYVSVILTMDKREIIIFTALLLLTALSLYRRYAAKKKNKGGMPGGVPKKDDSITGQPDDYEPYSGKK